MKPFLSYNLPKEKIASRPPQHRPSAKLLTLQNETETVTDLLFSNLPDILKKGDLLVLNNTRVRPCRFFVDKEGYSRKFEVLLVKRISSLDPHSENWEIMAKPMKKLKNGDRLYFSKDVTGLVGDRASNPALLNIQLQSSDKPLSEALEEFGLMPIPPYIRSGESDVLDNSDYQTIFAESGDYGSQSLAAPTAGLHFDKPLLNMIQTSGIDIGYLTLEVGLSSVKTVSEKDLEVGELDREYFCISSQLVNQIKDCKKTGGRVVAVGTTCVRSLESAALAGFFGNLLGETQSNNSEYFNLIEREDGYLGTNLFIRPGFHFSIVDSLITNFHLPNSTHLLLVNAFSSSTRIKKLYNYALDHNYRFFSYGDAMLL